MREISWFCPTNICTLPNTRIVCWEQFSWVYIYAIFTVACDRFPKHWLASAVQAGFVPPFKALLQLLSTCWVSVHCLFLIDSPTRAAISNHGGLFLRHLYLCWKGWPTIVVLAAHAVYVCLLVVESNNMFASLILVEDTYPVMAILFSPPPLGGQPNASITIICCSQLRPHL